MKKIVIEKIDDFKKFVETMEVNTRYVMPKDSKYMWVKIQKDAEYFSKDPYYTYLIEYNYDVCKRVGLIFPMKGVREIKTFKTEKGAKANFIKAYADYFETLFKIRP